VTHESFQPLALRLLVADCSSRPITSVRRCGSLRATKPDGTRCRVRTAAIAHHRSTLCSLLVLTVLVSRSAREKESVRERDRTKSARARAHMCNSDRVANCKLQLTAMSATSAICCNCARNDRGNVTRLTRPKLNAGRTNKKPRRKAESLDSCSLRLTDGVAAHRQRDTYTSSCDARRDSTWSYCCTMLYHRWPIFFKFTWMNLRSSFGLTDGRALRWNVRDFFFFFFPRRSRPWPMTFHVYIRRPDWMALSLSRSTSCLFLSVFFFLYFERTDRLLIYVNF